MGRGFAISNRIEELAELQKELCKQLRYGISEENNAVCEEIADVKIILSQLQMIFNKEKIDMWELTKYIRLEKTLEGL